MNESVKGKAIDTKLLPSENVMSIYQMLEHFNKLIDETPPIDQPQRFGNKAFTQWLTKISQVSTSNSAPWIILCNTTLILKRFWLKLMDFSLAQVSIIVLFAQYYNIYRLQMIHFIIKYFVQFFL